MRFSGALDAINAALARVTFVGDVDFNGESTATLTANDLGNAGAGGAREAEESFTIDVGVGNDAPTLAPIVDQRNAELDIVAVAIEATDPEGDPLTFSAQGLPPGVVIDPVSGTITGRLSVDAAVGSPYTVSVTVSDGQAQDADTFAWIVNNTNRPPVVSAGGPYTVAEGGAVTLTATGVDDDGEAISFTWDFTGNGLCTDAAGASVVFNAGDGDDVVRVGLCATDGIALVTEEAQITVQNQPPVINSVAPAFASFGRIYTYRVRAVDPGDDPMTFELVSGPDGMAFSGSVLRWTPTLEQTLEELHPVELQVCDEDRACATDSFVIDTAFDDTDEDGIPDLCEITFNLNPEDPTDAELDPDVDNISNRDECLDGTDPTIFNGPDAPGLVAPEPAERIGDNTPLLRVTNAVDPDGDPLTYAFEVFADEGLRERVAAIEGLPEGGEGAEPGETVGEIEVELEENRTFFWRATASDPRVAGPASSVGSFFVDVVNEPPSVPSPASPDAVVDTLQPALVVMPSVDPEGDGITYLFEVYNDEILEELTTAFESTETTRATDIFLEEDRVYFWRAAARDALEVVSDFSEPLSFRVNTENILPAAPALTLPAQPGDQLRDTPTVLSWAQVEDEDGDPVTYEIELAEDETFSAVIFEQRDLVPNESGAVIIAPEGLEEDKTYAMRVRGRDLTGPGAFAVSSFLINQGNTPPDLVLTRAPTAGSLAQRPVVSFTFANTTDLDGDPLTYDLRIINVDTGAEEFLIEGIEEGGGDQTTVDVVFPLFGNYTWAVTAVDDKGLKGVESAPVAFRVIDEFAGDFFGGSCDCATLPAGSAPLPAPLAALWIALGLVFSLRRRR